MTIQEDPEQLNYVSAMLHPLAPKVGSFLEHFLEACLRADHLNYPLIRPALMTIKEKYPADPERLAMDIEDAGMETDL